MMNAEFKSAVAKADMDAIGEMRDKTRLELADVSERFEHICLRFNACAAELEDLRDQVFTKRGKQGWDRDEQRRAYRDSLRAMSADQLRELLSSDQQA